MTRRDCELLVARYTITIGSYAAVSCKNVQRLLGDDWLEKMKSDPIKWIGPVVDYVYPWNVVDYLQLKEKSETDGNQP